jgi:hypothetical protein
MPASELFRTEVIGVQSCTLSRPGNLLQALTF